MARTAQNPAEDTEVVEDLRLKYLPNKKVVLKPTPRDGQMVNDPEHKMYFMAEDATIEWRLPLSRSTGQLYDVFESLEERKFFEKELAVDLNPLNRTNNFWWDFNIRVIKTPDLIDKGVVFDLTNPMDALKVKVLKTQADVAPSWDRRKKRPEYKWVLVDEAQEFVDRASEADMMAEAFTHYSSIKNSESKMIEFLRIYGSSKNMNRAIPKDAKISFLKGEISNIIENDIKGYLAIIKGGNFELKVLLENAVDVGAVDMKYNKYTLPGGDLINPLDSSYKGTIEALKEWANPKHESHEKYLTIKARVDNAK